MKGEEWGRRVVEQEAGRRGRGEDLYGSNVKTSTAVYKDSGIDTSHTSRLRNFVSSLSLGRLHLFVSLVLVFFVSGGQGLPFS